MNSIWQGDLSGDWLRLLARRQVASSWIPIARFQLGALFRCIDYFGALLITYIAPERNVSVTDCTSSALAPTSRCSSAIPIIGTRLHLSKPSQFQTMAPSVGWQRLSNSLPCSIHGSTACATVRARSLGSLPDGLRLQLVSQIAKWRWYQQTSSGRAAYGAGRAAELAEPFPSGVAMLASRESHPTPLAGMP